MLVDKIFFNIKMMMIFNRLFIQLIDSYNNNNIYQLVNWLFLIKDMIN